MGTVISNTPFLSFLSFSVDLCTALSRMRSHTQTLSSPSPGEDETDGHGFLGADNSAHAASSEEWWQRLLKSNTQRTSQQTYLRELFSLSGHVRTFESRKVCCFLPLWLGKFLSFLFVIIRVCILYAGGSRTYVLFLLCLQLVITVVFVGQLEPYR